MPAQATYGTAAHFAATASPNNIAATIQRGQTLPGGARIAHSIAAIAQIVNTARNGSIIAIRASI